MPALKRVRHERFAQNLAKGMTQRASYMAAGYQCTPDAADAAASRLLTSAKVEERVVEVLKPVAKEVRVTVASLVAEADAAMAAAARDGHHSAVIAALTLKAKVTGNLRDKVEVGGPGAFDALDTPEKVLEAVRRDLGPDAAAMLEASLAPAQADGEPKAIEQMGR
jgi:hypothetical protein